jgi:hypothetical protein
MVGGEQGPDGRDVEHGHGAQRRRGDRKVGQRQLGLLLHRSSPARTPTAKVRSTDPYRTIMPINAESGNHVSGNFCGKA